MEEAQESPQIVEDGPEDPVHYLSDENRVVVFRIPEVVERTADDEDDDFYELSLNEVKMLYKELQDARQELEEAPLLTRKHREEKAREQLPTYRQAVVRVEFPDRTVLQGVFSPDDSVGKVEEVIGGFLALPGSVSLFSAPPKQILPSGKSLAEVGLVPTGKVYYQRRVDQAVGEPLLRADVLGRLSSHQAASRAALHARTGNIKEKPSKEPVDKKPTTGTRPGGGGPGGGGGGGGAPGGRPRKDPSSLLKFLSKPSANIKTT